MTDLELLIRDKYEGKEGFVTEEDKERLAAGEPLAYVIGWIPFLNLRIDLASHPLIPRPETEWWTERLITRLRERFDTSSFTFLDLCAGSGAIGLSVLYAFPNANVSFGEVIPEHSEQIKRNIEINNLDVSRADVRTSDLFEAWSDTKWDVIASNPPYIPEGRELDASVSNFEPSEALFSGEDGLSLIKRIAAEAHEHLTVQGELWLEADTSNIQDAEKELLLASASKTVILTDLYDRQRVVVAYYS